MYYFLEFLVFSIGLRLARLLWPVEMDLLHTLFCLLKAKSIFPISPSNLFFLISSPLKFYIPFLCNIITTSASYVTFAVPNILPIVRLFSSSTFLGCTITNTCTYLLVANSLNLETTLSYNSNFIFPIAY